MLVGFYKTTKCLKTKKKEDLFKKVKLVKETKSCLFLVKENKYFTHLFENYLLVYRQKKPDKF